MIPVADIAYIAAELRRLTEELLAVFDERGRPADADPRAYVASLEDLQQRLHGLEDQREGRPENGDGGREADPGGEPGVGALGDHGIDLLARLASIAGRLHRPVEAKAVEGLSLPLACWVARRGGEIENLAPVVSAAAGLANRLRTPPELERLYVLVSEVVAAVSPRVSQEPAVHDPTRPWRMLVLNRAIVATRSHQPALMEEAFEHLTDQLPQEAPEFFREGMEQMEAIDYPPPVRAVMSRWYDRWCRHGTLH
jgi:hypothetical protein